MCYVTILLSSGSEADGGAAGRGAAAAEEQAVHRAQPRAVRQEPGAGGRRVLGTAAAEILGLSAAATLALAAAEPAAARTRSQRKLSLSAAACALCVGSAGMQSFNLQCKHSANKHWRCIHHPLTAVTAGAAPSVRS